MSDKSNADRLRAAYASWHETKGEDADPWLDLCHPNVQLVSSAAGNKGFEFAEPCGCLEDVRRYFSQLKNDWEMIHYTVENVIGEGDVLAVHGSTGWRHRTTGIEADVLKADVWTFQDGKAIRIIEHFDSGPASAAIAATG